MILGFVAQGILFGAAIVLLSRMLNGRTRFTMIVLAAAQVVGSFALALVPQTPQTFANKAVLIHFAGDALAILSGNLILLVAGWQHSQLMLPAWLGRAGIILGTIGIVSAISSLFFTAIPAPMWERASIYPFLGWQILAGVAIGCRRLWK